METAQSHEHSLSLVCMLKVDAVSDRVLQKDSQLGYGPALASEFTVCNHKLLGEH